MLYRLEEINGQLGDNMRRTEETLRTLCLRRQEELRLANIKRPTVEDFEPTAFVGLQRSQTDFFSYQQLPRIISGASDDDPCQGESTKWRKQAKRIFSSPRLRRKTHAQVLRAASSIPSCEFW